MPMSTLIGSQAPPFELLCTRLAETGRDRVALDDYRGRWLVLVFYPRDFSLICPTELIGLSQRFDEFAAHECALLGISCDSVESHEHWISSPRARGGLGGLNFPLASDTRRHGRPKLWRVPGGARGRCARAVHHRSRWPDPVPGCP